MDFWQAYQGMKRGEWHEPDGGYVPYRYANGRWETVGSRRHGQAVWNAEKEWDEYEYIDAICEADGGDDREFYFSMEEMNANWRSVDCSHLPREEDITSQPSATKAALDEAERIKWQHWNELHPPTVVPITMESLFIDNTAQIIDLCWSASLNFKKTLDGEVFTSLSTGEGIPPECVVVDAKD